ncbi:MAG TPA: GGDEF domain-containing protein [Mycobacteriales bacterium]|nr:GGDEF domain-containing protein [Mycobacteriales bacterium]
MRRSATVSGAPAQWRRLWLSRFGGQPPAVVHALADEVAHAVAGRRDDPRLASTAGALGVLRAQQGHTVRALIEDVAALRALLTAQAPTSPERHRVIDDVLAAATTGYVDELTAILESQATRDPLTGLPNRAGFNEVLGHEISSSERTAPPALLLIDLDGFKGVNDTDGHLAGDAVLRGVAGVLVDVARTSDVACRLGGDEFAIVLPRTSQRQAMAVARRLLSAARAAGSLASPHARVTLSIGIGWLPDARSVDELVAVADAALYRVKGAGGNAVATGTPADREAAQP